jgi:hypothetical protein
LAGAGLLFGAANSVAAAQGPSGDYRSFDGRVQHSFDPFANYAATVVVGTRFLSFSGIYQDGKNVCFVNGPRGSGGGAGNVLLYVGGNECCLRFRPIYDKVIVTKVGMTGDAHGPGYFLCTNQTLRRTGAPPPEPPPVPPMSTARPRLLVPEALQ